MGKGAMQQQNQMATTGQWNVMGGGQTSQHSFTDGWHRSVQDYEHLSNNRREGSKRVTWDELVHVRTIASCNHGHGHWHKSRHGHGSQSTHGNGYRQNSLNTSVTSPIYDL